MDSDGRTEKKEKEEGTKLYQLVPFRLDEHGGKHPKGGYVHLVGVNRAGRRMMARTRLSRRGRMMQRWLRRPTVLIDPETGEYRRPRASGRVSS